MSSSSWWSSSLSVSPDNSPIQHARNASGMEGPPAHVAPNAAAAATASGAGPDPVEEEEGLGQQGSDSSGHRLSWRLRNFLGAGSGRQGSPNQISPDGSGYGPPPPPVQQGPMDAAVVGRGTDLSARNFVRRRRAQGGGGSGGAPAGGPGPCPGVAPWLPLVGVFSFLTFNTAMAVYESWGDVEAISFFGSTYATMLSLFVSLKLFLAAPLNSVWRDVFVVSALFFIMVLTCEFIFKITVPSAKPPTLHVALILWVMSAAIGASVVIIFWDRFRAPRGEELPDIPLDDAPV